MSRLEYNTCQWSLLLPQHAPWDIVHVTYTQTNGIDMSNSWTPQLVHAFTAKMSGCKCRRKMLTTTAKREQKHQKLQPENLAIVVVSNFIKSVVLRTFCLEIVLRAPIPIKPQMTNNDKQIFMLTFRVFALCSLLAPSCLRTQTHHNAALLSWRCCDHLRFDDFLETIFKESLHFGQNKKWREKTFRNSVEIFSYGTLAAAPALMCMSWYGAGTKTPESQLPSAQVNLSRIHVVRWEIKESLHIFHTQLACPKLRMTLQAYPAIFAKEIHIHPGLTCPFMGRIEKPRLSHFSASSSLLVFLKTGVL